MARIDALEVCLGKKILMNECQSVFCKIFASPQSPQAADHSASQTKLDQDSVPSTPSQHIAENSSVTKSGYTDVFSSTLSILYPQTQRTEARAMEGSEEYSGSSSSSTVDEIKKENGYSSTESNKESESFCTPLNLDKMELESVFEDFDIELNGHLDLSDLDMDPIMLAELPTNSNDEIDFNAFCMDDVPEKDLAEEEALILAEVSKAERKQLQEQSQVSTTLNSTLASVKEEFSAGKKKSSREEVHKSSSRSPPLTKRKVKVDWTPDLHRRFVQAVEQLGVDKAVPSRILELMGVTCLTRHNIKYRSHRKHLLAREAEAATWNQRRQLYDGSKEARSWTAQNRSPLIHPRPPAIGYPSITPASHVHPPYRPPLHVWGHPTVDHSMVHMWKKPYIPTAASTWQQSQAGKDNSWTPAAPAPGTPIYHQQSLIRPSAPLFPAVPGCIPQVYSSDFNSKSHPPKEAVDAAISEVLSNPWTPLPIGLNPPSLQSVMAELERQGVSHLPRASA
eukprot:TRINITY_DN198_c0_g1_i7.p1 TRINITY_DN198_c0_g1~~TRINITY_DN198_c0_g1_i7.p1  ORF type:complete len:508 (-),score=50.13 TRINITY_DN198_c0_g1_i7:800-2323(-)